MAASTDIFDTTLVTELVNADIRARLSDPENMKAVLTVLRMADHFTKALSRVADTDVITRAVLSPDLTIDQGVAMLLQSVTDKAAAAAGGGIGE